MNAIEDKRNKRYFHQKLLKVLLSNSRVSFIRFLGNFFPVLWWRGSVVISSASGAEDPSSNPGTV
jgi:hypothetical protein